jgi:hypothetical protein
VSSKEINVADPHVSTSITRARSGKCWSDRADPPLTLQAVRTPNVEPLRAASAATPPTTDGVVLAEDSLVELGTPLCALVGVEGYRALLARALEVAAADYPMLGGVRPGTAPPGRLVGWKPGTGQARPADADAAVTATLAVLFRLLDQFLGHDMTQRVIGEVWPGLTDGHVFPTEPMCVAG